MADRHAPDNLKITIRARREWVARVDAAAQAAGESRMAYIRQAVEQRMAREAARRAGVPGMENVKGDEPS